MPLRRVPRKCPACRTSTDGGSDASSTRPGTSGRSGVPSETGHRPSTRVVERAADRSASRTAHGINPAFAGASTGSPRGRIDDAAVWVGGAVKNGRDGQSDSAAVPDDEAPVNWMRARAIKRGSVRARAGSAVLTLTSLGMVERSRPPGVAPSRVVALWKDPTGASVRSPSTPAPGRSCCRRRSRQPPVTASHIRRVEGSPILAPPSRRSEESEARRCVGV
jgi:hypothetical protein